MLIHLHQLVMDCYCKKDTVEDYSIMSELSPVNKQRLESTIGLNFSKIELQIMKVGLKVYDEEKKRQYEAALLELRNKCGEYNCHPPSVFELTVSISFLELTFFCTGSHQGQIVEEGAQHVGRFRHSLLGLAR